MKATVGMRVKVTRHVSRQVEDSISETIGQETLVGTVKSADVIPGGYTDGREFVSLFVMFDNGDFQTTGDVGQETHGFPVISVEAA